MRYQVRPLPAVLVLAAIAVATALAPFASARCPDVVSSVDYGRDNRLPNDITVRYGLAYAADDYGLTVYRLDGPDAIEVVGELELEGECLSITVAGSIACVTRYGRSTAVVDISVPSQPHVLSFIEIGTDVAITRGHALSVSSRDVTITDLSEATAPTERGTVEWWAGWKKARAAVAGFWLLVATGSEEVVLVDISDFDAPRVSGTLEVPGTASDVAAEHDLAVVADPESGLLVLELRGGAPELIATLPLPGAERVLLARNTAIVTTTQGALHTVDLGRPDQPKLIGALALDGQITAVAERSGEVVLTDTASGLRRVDLSDLSAPSLRPERARCHGIGSDLVVVDSTAIVANGPAGLLIADVRYPRLPRELSRLELDGGANALALDRDRALLLATGNSGLHILDVSRPRSPRPMAHLPLEGRWVDLVLQTTTAHLLSEAGDMARVNTSDPHSPTVEAMLTVTGAAPASAFDIAADHALIAGHSGVWSVHLSDPAQIPAQIDIGWSCESVRIDRDHALAGCGPILWDIDLTSNPPVLNRWGSTDVYFAADLDLTTETTLLVTSTYRSAPVLVGFDTRDLAAVPAGFSPHCDVGCPDPPRLAQYAATTTPGSTGRAFVLDPATGHGWMTSETTLAAVDLGCSTCPGVQLEATPQQILTGGEHADIIASVTDLIGRPVTGAALTGTTTLGSLSEWTEAGNGRYTAELVSGRFSGTATIQILFDGIPCSATTSVAIECATPLPSPPSNVTTTPVPGPGLQVSWDLVGGAHAYIIYRSSVPIDTVDGTTTSYEMSGLSDGATYTVAVSSTDICGRESEPSDAVEVTLPGVPVLTVETIASVQLGQYAPSVDLSIHDDSGLTADPAGVAVWDLSDPQAPTPVGRWSWSDGGYHVAAAGSDHALVTTRRGNAVVLDISDPSHPVATGGLPFPFEHGWIDSLAASPDGRWGYIGRFSSVLVVDLANPREPEVVAQVGVGRFLDMTLAGNRLVGVREDGRLTMIDVSDPTDPEIVNGAPTDQLETARCVAAAGSLAVVGLASGAAIVDLTDGSLLARVDDAELRFEALSALDDHRVAGVDGHDVWTIDVSDPSVPIVNRRTTAPGVRLASGAGFLWLAAATGVLRTVDSSNWTVAADLTDQLGDAHSVATTAGGTIAVANGGGGLVLLDTADPSLAPTISARVPTPGTAHDVVAHSSGHLLVADGAAGLTVMTTSGDLVARLSLQQSSVTTIEANDELAVLGSDSTLFAVDVTDPATPQLLSSTYAYEVVSSFGLVGNRVHLETVDIDLTNPRSPVVLPLPEETRGCQGRHMAASLPLVFVANRAPLTVCQQTAAGWLTPITDEVPSITTRLDTADIALTGSDVVLLGPTWLYLIDSSDPAAPFKRAVHLHQFKPARSINLNGRIGYITSPMNLEVVVLTGST